MAQRLLRRPYNGSVVAAGTERGAHGLFAPGNRFAEASRRRPTLDQVLKSKTDPARLSEQLLELCWRPGRDQLSAIRYCMDRIAGAPRQMVAVSLDEDSPQAAFMRLMYERLGGQLPAAAIDAEVRELPAAPNA